MLFFLGVLFLVKPVMRFLPFSLIGFWPGVLLVWAWWLVLLFVLCPSPEAKARRRHDGWIEELCWGELYVRVIGLGMAVGGYKKNYLFI